MLTPQSLRIGNLLQERNSGATGTVSAPSGNAEMHSWIDQYEPIPITQEWLEKFGFEKDDSGEDPSHPDYVEWYRKEFPVIGILCQSSDKMFLFDENTDTLRIYYVHQLQNLVYALTGQELTIKQSEE